MLTNSAEPKDRHPPAVQSTIGAMAVRCSKAADFKVVRHLHLIQIKFPRCRDWFGKL